MMEKYKYYEEMSIEDAFAACLDPFRQGELSLQQCLDRFPQHRDELEELLSKFSVILSNPIVTPRLAFQRTGYQQVMSRLVDPKTVVSKQIKDRRNVFSKPVSKLRFRLANLIIAFIVAFAALSGGVAYASNAAGPGDLLFSLDQTIEQVRLDLARDAESAANLHLGFAAERLEESQNKLEQGDIENAEAAIQAYNNEIASLAQLVDDAGDDDQEALMALLDSAREKHLTKLAEVAAKVPPQAQASIQRVIDRTSALFDSQDEMVEETGEDDLEQVEKEQNPVVLYLAGMLDAKYDDIITLQQEEGYGLGNISAAYYIMSLAASGDLEGFSGDIPSILAAAKEMGWGNYYKSLGLDPGVDHGLGWMFKENGKLNQSTGKPEWVTNGPPDHANNDKDKEPNPIAEDAKDKDKDKDKEDKDKDK